jgi:excisionase family DNA binding protein
VTDLTLQLPADVVEAIAQRAAELVLERQSPVGESPSPFMTVAEAAEYLRCKRQRVDDLLSSGRLTRHKDGSRTLVSRRELEEHVGADCPPVAGRGASRHLQSVRAASR